jgi:phosphatidylglycerophosphatase A
MKSSALAEAILGVLGLSGGELVLVLVVLLVLFGSDRIPPFARGLGHGVRGFFRAGGELGRDVGESLGAGLGKPVADALSHSNQTWEFLDPPALRLRQIRMRMKKRLTLWVAQGFGLGRIRFAPGTFGSLVGLLWFALLLSTGSGWFYVIGMVAGFFLSVWLCGAAEKILSQTDPGSVVLDEIIAVPICFAAWVGALVFKNGALPSPAYFFNAGNWPLTLGIVAAFRLFDVLKPWPVRQSQRFPGGWGVTVDDVLAALYVNALVALAWSLPIGR